MKLLNYLLVLIGSLLFTIVKAEDIPVRQLKFETITINDGLSQGMVNAMLQDRYGFMWFATKDGLNRFDGYHFTVYKHDPSNNKSIADNFIQTIFEDSKGRLWIGTASKGLDLFERETETFQHFQHDDSRSNSISNDQVNHILEDHLGNIFLNTQSGINKLTISETNGKKTFSFQLKNWCRGNLFASNSKFLFISNRAMLFKIAENKKGIDYIDSIDLNKVKTGIPAGEKITAGFNSFLEDTINHRCYFFSEQYIFSLNEADNHFEMIYKNNHGGIFHPHFDESNFIWCCNYDWAAQFNLQKKTMTRILADDKNLERMLNSINCIYIDHSGIVWIGTKGFGVLKYNPRSEKFHSTISQSTGFMSPALDGKIIFTNLNQNNFNQFNRGEEGYKTVVPNNNSLPSLLLNNYRTVDDALQDEDGNYWVGKGNLLCYNAAKNSIEEYKTGNQYNFPIYKNRKNEIWFGCENAFCYFDKANKKTIKYPFQFPVSNSPYKFLEVIYQAADDIFWLGTSAGILRFDVKKKEWKQFKNNPDDSSSLSFDLVFSICSDPKHPSRYLWIGTNGGLNKFDTETGKAIRFSEKNGLANNVIYGILSDVDGNLWMSTNKGLSRFNPEKKIFRNFEMKDGLQGNEFNRYAYCKTKDGILFFGGMNGFNYFNPKELIDNPFRPKVQITDFKISNQSVAIGGANSPLTKPIYLTNEIELNYADNMISFDFAAFDFTASPNNLYQYKLEGFDKEWIQSGTNHTATYTNLNPGVYTFKVKGSNSDGVWNEEGTAIKIIIHPPWYMTWWFRVSLVLLAFGIVYSIYKYRLNETIKLQQIRNRIAGDLHDEIGSTLSSISLFSEVVKKKTRATMPEVTPMLTRISENIDNMMEAMNDIVWTINSSNDSFENIITRIRATAAELFEAKGYELHLDFDEKLNQVNLGMQERKNIYLLFKEASNNIAKYADGKNVFLSIHLDKKNIEMKIADDGKGFDIATAVNGYGMNTMKKRAEELKGKLKIKSAINEGTMIEIIFPIT